VTSFHSEAGDAVMGRRSSISESASLALSLLGQNSENGECGRLGKNVLCHAWILIFLAWVVWSRAEAAPYVDDTVQDQWFTGSLVAPSPALTKAGIFAIEPYAIYTGNTGAYNSGWGHHSVPNDINQIESLTLLKYSITDRLTVQALPSFNHAWNGLTNSNGLGAGDLPVELQYRINDENRKTGFPMVTVSLGATFPTGQYSNLRNASSGFGSGAYTLNQEVLLQSMFNGWGGHPVRVRLYGDIRESLGNVSVKNVSVYQTSQGFIGQAKPGLTADWGIGVEYGLSQRWALALDLAQNYGGGFRLHGIDATGNFMRTNHATSTSVVVAPAIEYNFSSRAGLVVGVEFSAAGRNSASYIAPQIALSLAF